MTKRRQRKARRPVVAVPDPSYLHSRAQLREDQRMDATFDQAVGALTRDVTVKYVKPKKNRWGLDPGRPCR